MNRPSGEDPLKFADRYDLGKELGRGGGAVVYLARDPRNDRQVAIKVLLASIASAVSLDRFLREVRIAARLVHPNIVQLFDSGAADGLPFYVMPFVEGETLRDWLKREPRLSVSEAVRVTREVADALDYAHAAGIVHRDIKPENILLAAGHAMVADFGIAKAMTAARTSSQDEANNTTSSEHVVGTPRYMSPEQQMGDERLDGRSDLYSLATVLYEMLAGAVPFDGKNTAEIFAHRFMDDPRPLSESRGDIPPALEQVLARALAREPSHRFATGREFAQELSAAVGADAVSPSEQDAPPSIAVLPFTFTPPDPESEYFSDGMTDGIMCALGRLRRLSVVARTSVFALKGKYDDIREMGRRLNVRWMLEGTIRRRGNQLRITVNLVFVADGFSVLNQEFDREIVDAIAIQDEIAHAIAEAVRPSILGVVPPSPYKPAPETYRLYLLGRHYWNLRTPDAMVKAGETFRQVVEQDPMFPLGHAGVADVHHSSYIYGYADPLISLPLARDAALRAIELDAFAAEPHAALGTVRAVLDWNWIEAAAEFRRAIALDPTYSSAYGWFANYVLLPLGRYSEALAELARARGVDPLSAHIGGSFGMAYYYARRYEESEAECRAVLDFAPHFLIAHYFLGRSLVERGQIDEGLASFRTVAKLSGGHPHAPAVIGYAYAKAGDRTRAEAELKMLSALSKQRFVSSCLPAQIHAALGNMEEAIAGFEQGFAEHSTDLLWLGIHPGLDGMRMDPRFQAILRRIGLVGSH